jgi:hypothetical protein
MQFSEFLNSRREACRALVAELGKTYAYVGILGSDVKSSAIRVNRTEQTDSKELLTSVLLRKRSS